MKKINIAGPSITELEINMVNQAVTDGWYENAGYYTSKFETTFSKYVGRKYAVSLPSCTSALHLSLASLGISEGDEVIVPDITWIATSAPISYVGAKPVFADVDEKSWCISVDSIKKNITKKTKAIILVDLYGNMPALDEILKIAKENNIYVIEDSAEAIGSEYKGKKAGSFGDFSTFSFHGSKTLTTGEGGMLVTDNDSFYEKVCFLRDHGRDSSSGKMFWNSEVAFKYKMSNLQAALGLAQLNRIDELIAKKIQTFDWYKNELKDFEGIKINSSYDNVKNTYWMVSVIWDSKFNISKEKMISELSSFNIESRPFFYPLSSMPPYISNSKNNFVSYKISEFAINLPSSLRLTEEEVKYTCEKFKSILINRK